MPSNKLRLVSCFSLILVILSLLIFSDFVIKDFSNDLNDDNKDLKGSGPLISTVDSELKMIWNHTYGEFKSETVKSLVRLSNGNYVLSGYMNVSDNFDFMIRCFTANGLSLWNRTFGYTEDDYGFQVIGCASGGVAVVGRITNTSVMIDNNDACIVRMAPDGTQLWNRTYIGPEQTPSSIKDDRAYSIAECGNGDFVAAGVSNIDNEGSNVWLFRVDSTGTLLWNKTYHHWDIDRCFEPHCLVQTQDNGFTIAGYTFNSTQSNDVWLIHTNAAGVEIWNKTFGAIDEYQRPNALVECVSGGYGILAANKTSGGLYTDAWIIRTDSTGNEIWNKTYGGKESDGGSQLIEMPDGGFVFVGSTHSFDIGQGDLWLVRTYANGSIMWNHTVATPYGENGVSFVYEGNNTYTIAGHHNPVGMPGSVISLMKVRVSITLPQGEENPPGIGGFNHYLIWLIVILSSIGIASARKSKKRIEVV
ncbi:MAG: hypothetical protein ACFE9R_12655 [Candidatus Hermodarchaeota archaeon]